jgi:hypothetical protein
VVRPSELRREHANPPASTSNPKVAGSIPALPTFDSLAGLHDVDDRVAHVDVEAGGGEECSADVPGEEGVAAAAVGGGEPVGLGERVDGEAAGALEPALVAGAREGFEEREAVAGRAVAEAVSFLVAVGAGLPDELGACEQEVLVEVVPGAGVDTRSAGAPLETD